MRRARGKVPAAGSGFDGPIAPRPPRKSRAGNQWTVRDTILATALIAACCVAGVAYARCQSAPPGAGAATLEAAVPTQASVVADHPIGAQQATGQLGLGGAPDGAREKTHQRGGDSHVGRLSSGVARAEAKEPARAPPPEPRNQPVLTSVGASLVPSVLPQPHAPPPASSSPVVAPVTTPVTAPPAPVAAESSESPRPKAPTSDGTPPRSPVPAGSRQPGPVSARVSPPQPHVPLVAPLPADIEQQVKTCALFSEKDRKVQQQLFSEAPRKCGSVDGGSTGAKAKITLKSNLPTVFRPLQCEKYQRCPNFVAEVLAFHVAAVMGLPNRVPPVVFRKVPYNWLDKQCGGVPIRKPGKKKKKKNMRGRKLLADPTLDPDSLATTTGRVVASPNDEAGFAHSRSLAGYMRRPVDVQPDGTVLGAMQVMWKNIKASKSIDGKFKPGRSKWIEWANDPNFKVKPFDASKWSEWADLMTFDHIMDNYDRSRDWALWKNVHWEPTADGFARVVYIDQNSCLAQRRFSPSDKNKFYGLCRFRRSTVTRLRQLVGKLGRLVYQSVTHCDPYPDHVPLLRGMTQQQAMYVYDDLDARLQTALDVIDGCIERLGEDHVLSLP